MAEAFANHYGRGRVVASSAGTVVAEKVNPIVAEAMKEKGIDISGNKPKLLTQEMVKRSDKVITMGCSLKEVCPAPLLKNVEDWGLEDPKEKPIQRVREIRDEIERKVRELLTNIEERTHNQ